MPAAKNTKGRTATAKGATKGGAKSASKRSATGEATVRTALKAPGKSPVTSPSRRIDARIKELGDWRGETLSRIRALIKQVIPGVVEEWKWRGVPVWYHDGMLCTGETYQAVVKVTFARGAALDDPSRLFNASLEGNTRRAIDIRDGQKLDEKALKALFQAAADLNSRNLKRGKRRD